jgi:hypothetical protein
MLTLFAAVQGGYFVINGSEKVLIAQERMAANRVYVFAKTQPSPITFLAEIRSAVEKGGKTISSMQIKMMRRTERQVRDGARVKEKGDLIYSSCDSQSGQTIKTSLPYIRNDIPIVVVFRALDIIPDKDILDHICYDRNDSELFEMLKPCLEDAFPIQNRDVSIRHSRYHANGVLSSLTPPPSSSVLSSLIRSRLTLLVVGEPSRPLLVIAESTTRRRFFRRRCSPTSRWRKDRTPRRPISSATWFTGYSSRRSKGVSSTIGITLARRGSTWRDRCSRRCSGCSSAS